MVNDVKEVLEREAQEIRDRAEADGVDIDLETLEEATSINEAYLLGRYEQIISTAEELEIESELLDSY